MSTTVQYKGNILTTATNQTRTLKTSGKYLEDDITVIDITSVPSGNIDITQAGVMDVTNYATATVSEARTLAAFNYVYVTESNTRKWRAITSVIVDPEEGGQAGWIDEGTNNTLTNTFNAIPSNTSITPTESPQTIGGTNYMMEGAVTVNAIPSNYVGSGITQRDSNDLTVSGATVTAPAGYYSAAAQKSVASMTLPTAASSSVTSGYTSKATISRSTSAQYINIPPGYNSTGAYYVISATPNGSVTAPSTISGTTATVSTGTNTLTLTKTVSVTPNVTTAGYISSGTAGNSSVSLTASVTTKAAATYRASTSAQTIAAGTYLTGAQTIAAVSQTNLSAANIKAGTTISVNNGSSNIWSVAGTYTSDATATASDILDGETAYANGSKLTGTLSLTTVYTGSTAPSSSLGSNGDIYIQS